MYAQSSPNSLGFPPANDSNNNELINAGDQKSADCGSQTRIRCQWRHPSPSYFRPSCVVLPTIPSKVDFYSRKQLSSSSLEADVPEIKTNPVDSQTKKVSNVEFESEWQENSQEEDYFEEFDDMPNKPDESLTEEEALTGLPLTSSNADAAPRQATLGKTGSNWLTGRMRQASTAMSTRFRRLMRHQAGSVRGNACRNMRKSVH